MLPLHSSDPGYKPGMKLTEKIRGWLRLIFADQSSRNIFLFLIINLTMAFVELLYGVWTNSLGLISDSFHMFFDCTALLAGLIASLISRWRANDHFSYGFVRAEVIAGFVNALFLIFIAFFIFSEAIERVFEPPHVEHERLLPVSILGFLVNLLGIFAFSGLHGHSHDGGGHEHSHGGHGHSHAHSHSHGTGHGHDHGHSHDHSDEGHSHTKSSQNQILQGVTLHILADTLGSVGVIISSILIQLYGWHIADPICSLVIAILVGFSVIPLLRDSTGILMQRQPTALDQLLPGCYTRVSQLDGMYSVHEPHFWTLCSHVFNVSQLDGVYSVHEPHFWTLCSDVYVGAVKLEVAKDADTRYVQSQTHNIFTAAGVKQLYVQIDVVGT